MADGDYVTQAQVIARFGSERDLAYLTGDEASGTVETTDIDSAIEYGEGQINVALAERYATPVNSSETSVNEFLRRLAEDLAVYHLWARKPPVDETTQAMYDQATAMLDLFAEGKRSLPGASTPAGPTSSDPMFTASSQTDNAASKRVFTRTKTARM